MMQALRGSSAASIIASSMLGWLATTIRPGSPRNGRRDSASRRNMPVAAASRQKLPYTQATPWRPSLRPTRSGNSQYSGKAPRFQISDETPSNTRCNCSATQATGLGTRRQSERGRRLFSVVDVHTAV